MRMCKHILAVADMADMHTHIIGIYLIPSSSSITKAKYSQKTSSNNLKSIYINKWHMSMKRLGQFKKAFVLNLGESISKIYGLDIPMVTC